MPARKLSQADLDDLRDAETELLRANPRRITRPNGDGHPVVITTLDQLAKWKGISESHFYSLKRKGWKLQRGVPYEDRTVDNVPADVMRITYEMLQDRVDAKERRIAELEARLAECEAELNQLRRNQ